VVKSFHKTVSVTKSPPGRVCAHSECERVLSVYNHTDLCKTHGSLKKNSDGTIKMRSTRDDAAR